jgi:hypothetical protein
VAILQNIKTITLPSVWSGLNAPRIPCKEHFKSVLTMKFYIFLRFSIYSIDKTLCERDRYSIFKAEPVTKRRVMNKVFEN